MQASDWTTPRRMPFPQMNITVIQIARLISTSSDLRPIDLTSSSKSASAIHCQRSSDLFSNWLESKIQWQQISNGGQSWWSFQLGSTFRKSKRTWKLALDNSLYLKRRKQISRFYGYKNLFPFFPFITKTTGRTSIYIRQYENINKSCQ